MNDNKKTKPGQPDFEAVARAERFLNRVLGYQAAIAVHQLSEEHGLDVEELSLTVGPISSEAVGAYRVVCTIVRANAPEPIVLESIVKAEKALAIKGSTSNRRATRQNGKQATPSKR